MKTHCLSIILLLSLLTGTGFSQGYVKKSNFELDFGLGYLDLLHVGMKYELVPQSKIGMSYGSLISTRASERKINSVTLEHEYHFGQKLMGTPENLLYFSQKLTYLTDTDLGYDTSLLFITPSIGKRFYSDGPLGINIDVGVMFRVLEQQTTLIIDDNFSLPDYPAIFPALRFQFFFQL